MPLSTRRRFIVRTVPGAAAAFLAACGNAGKVEDNPKTAAEPAAAPSLGTPPAGTISKVAPQPEGIVYDTATRSLAVAVRDPNRLLVLDPTTFKTRFSVPLPGTVRHLQVIPRGGTVLVPAESANELVEVDLRTRRTRITPVQRQPHDAAGADDGTIVVGNEFAGSLSVVRNGTVVHTFSDLKQPGGVVVDADTVAAVDVAAYTVSTYDLKSMTRLARVEAGAGPTHVALIGDHRIAVADTRGGQMLSYTLDPLRQVGRLVLGDRPYGLAEDPVTGLLWVTLTETNQLVGLDVGQDTPTLVDRYPTARQPNTVAIAPRSRELWVTGTADGVLQRIRR